MRKWSQYNFTHMNKAYIFIFHVYRDFTFVCLLNINTDSHIESIQVYL